MSRRVTVSGLSWPMRWLRPMACRSKLGLSVGSHRLHRGGRGARRNREPRLDQHAVCVDPGSSASYF